MELLFNGTASWLPETGRETASFAVNGRHLIDTGWWPVQRLPELGIDLVSLESIVFTHFHQDHYIGLPQLIFYSGMRRRQAGNTAPLRIIGPAENLERLVRATQQLLQWDRFPELEFDIEIEPITPGKSFSLGDVNIDTMAAKHVSGKGDYEPALSLRLTAVGGGPTIVVSGDTSYHPPLAEFAAGARVLAHDAAHCSAKDAAEIARAAGVDDLYLVHYSRDAGERLLAEARGVFPRAHLAHEGLRVTV